MPSHAHRFGDDNHKFPPSGSRIRKYVQQQAAKQAESRQIEALQDRLEEEERRNLRLSSELLEETRERARAERVRDDLRAELLNISVKPTEKDTPDESSGSKAGTRQSGKHVGDSGTVPDSQGPGDDNPEHAPDSSGEQTDDISETNKGRTTTSKPKGRPRSSGSTRVRGNLK